jgi:hypothetical protein
MLRHLLRQAVPEGDSVNSTAAKVNLDTYLFAVQTAWNVAISS